MRTALLAFAVATLIAGSGYLIFKALAGNPDAPPAALQVAKQEVPVAAPTPGPPRPPPVVAEPKPAPEPPEPAPEPTPKPARIAAPRQPNRIRKVPAAKPEKAEIAPPPLETLPPNPEETVRNTLKLAMPALEGCYEQSLRKNARVKGKIEVSVSVSASGQVQSARIVETNVRDEDVMDCIASRLRQLRFPPLGEDVDLKLPMALVPRAL